LDTQAFNTELFNAVWHRVTSQNAGTANDADTLKEIIIRISALSQGYRRAAMHFNVHSKIFRFLSSESSKQLSHLQTEYFLLCGDTCFIQTQNNNQLSALLPYLRQCFSAEHELAALCSNAAKNSAKPRLSDLLSKLSNLSMLRSERIFSILQSQIN